MSASSSSGSPPVQPITREESRAVDRLASEELAIPGIVLMENAGRGAAELALELLADRRAAGALVVCGGGNNGGDGFVVARHLALAGVAVRVAALQKEDRARGDAAVMRRIVERMELPLHVVGDARGLDAARAALGDRAPALVVDALLGTGFHGAVREDAARAIEWIGELCVSGATVLALDVPSGLDCDTGLPATPTVRADRTATFVARKVGFDRATAAEWLGRVDVVSIGAPPSLVERARRS